MKPVAKLSCCIGTTDASIPLGVELWLNNSKIFDCDHVKEIHKINHALEDHEGEHQLCFVLKNKLPSHTEVDQQGNIVKDARLLVSDLQFEEIELNQVFVEHAVYEHDFNGTGSLTKEKFYGEMGCNGVVTLKFNTPIYLWLLENM
jgi:hypothetical protein